MRYGRPQSDASPTIKEQIREAGRRIGFAPPLLLLAFLLPAPGGEHRLAGLPSLCFFRNVTGLPCPGCGITRAVVSCAHGDLVHAIAYHPLGPLVFLTLLAVALSRLPRFSVIDLLSQRGVTLGAWSGVVALGAIWLARLAGYLPSPP